MVDTDPDAYTPKYVTTSDVPIEVPDDYSESEKRTALFNAEADLELDLNGGDEIPQNEITQSHVKAVVNLATYHLVRPAVSPDDVTLGDLGDGGDQREAHAEQYVETYEREIQKIAENVGGESGVYYGASGGGEGPFTANTRQEHRYGRNERRRREGSRTSLLNED